MNTILSFGARQLLRSVRTGSNPGIVALWGVVVAVAGLRRLSRPARRPLTGIDLEPGTTYLIRVAKKGDAPLPQPVIERFASLPVPGPPGEA